MAVYTDVSDEQLAAFLTHYDVGPVLGLKGIAEGVENSNFLLSTEGSDGARINYILTLYEKRVNKDDLPFFLNLMDHLAQGGLACPVPIKGKDGKTLHELNGRPAAIISFLDGMSVARPNADHCFELGTAMAQMHVLGQSFNMQRANSLGLAGWKALADENIGQADDVTHGLAKLIEDELSWLGAHWPSDLPSGVIHADLFPDNVFFRGQSLSGVIDFYFACTDALVYDIAICLNAWCFEADHSFNVTKARRMLAGYQSVRPLNEAEFFALPVLARGAALRFLLTRLHDWFMPTDGALVRKKDPMEYVKKLRFHQHVTSASAYGIDQ